MNEGFYRNEGLLMPRRQAVSLIGGSAAGLLLSACGGWSLESGTEMEDGNMDLSGGLPVEREHFYEAKPGPEVRDAANVWFEEENAELAMRIGIEHVAEEWDSPELWLDIAFPDGRVISGREHGASGPGGDPTKKRCGPLQFKCVEPFKHWKITFDPHKVRELTAQQLIALDIPNSPPMRDVAFELDYFPAVPPLISGTLTADSKKMMS